ncbi:MAG: hypothetical protein IKE46_06170 [Selenomonadaceae bacterium]|nr:hypothetical protein [Selenomonadaceae bacterium]
MATIDRFKEMMDSGKIKSGDIDVPFSAQLKYDWLAAIHTMEQLENLAAEIESRKKYRTELREKLLRSCSQSLKKLGEDEEGLTVKKIDAAIKMLMELRMEIVKVDSAAKESEKLAKFIRDGVSAGR